jgi:hypothetical protein
MSQSVNDSKGAPRATASDARRAFLAKVGRAALVAPPVASLILAADDRPANAKSRYGKPDKKPHKKPVKKPGHD